MIRVCAGTYSSSPAHANQRVGTRIIDCGSCVSICNREPQSLIGYFHILSLDSSITSLFLLGDRWYVQRKEKEPIKNESWKIPENKE